MNVRKATQADIPAIIAMGARFYETTSYARLGAYDPESVARLAASMLDGGVLLLVEEAGQPVGMVGLLFAPFMFNAALRVAYEVVWWVNPEARGGMAGARLLKAVEPACREAGCVAVQMVHMADSPPQAGALYERFGYRHSETSWTKELQDGSYYGGGNRSRRDDVCRARAEERG